MTRWLDPAPVNSEALQALNLSPLIAATLVRRGFEDPAAARDFLLPDKMPSTPFPGVESAIEHIISAIRKKEAICIWGDFDVDGQTSTALLVQTLRALKANVSYYIPIRGKEGHGVHLESLKHILDQGARLLITCDTGITAHEAIDYANQRGVDVIVTDHHDIGKTLPGAKSILNPKLLPQDHPLFHLAGVGVAYKLAEALVNQIKPAIELPIENEQVLDLVALGLIADVALLKSETRALAYKGIRALRATNRLGLKVMAELAGTNLETLTEETIGFTFAPRLNALGRLGDANPAIDLLLTEEPARARVLATQIEGLNAQRRLLTSQVYAAAQAQLSNNPGLLAQPAIVLSHPNWPGGVVGIVANKLVERYHKPAILLTESEDGVLRGSARSVEGLHITQAISANSQFLLGFGGHPMAAGLSLQKEDLPSFCRGLGNAIEKQLGAISRAEPTLQIDAWVRLEEINQDLAIDIESLAPFGAGNPPLIMATRNVTLKSIATLGRTKEHLRLTVENDSGTEQSLLWWGGAGEEPSDASGAPRIGARFDIAYSLRASSYRGQRQVTLQFNAFREMEEKPVEIPKSMIEIIDWRTERRNFENLDSNVLVWAEGSDKARGKARAELQPADTFAIFTCPASSAELRKALEIVKPKTVYLLAVSPTQEEPDHFLKRLAGLCKFAINQRAGKATIQEFAGAMASRQNAIQLGLQWLAAGGHLSMEIEEDEVVLSPEPPQANPFLQKELYIALKALLLETTAYRDYFASVKNAQALLDEQA